MPEATNFRQRMFLKSVFAQVGQIARDYRRIMGAELDAKALADIMGWDAPSAPDDAPARPKKGKAKAVPDDAPEAGETPQETDPAQPGVPEAGGPAQDEPVTE